MSGNKSKSHPSRWIVIVLFVCITARLIFFGFAHPWNPEAEEKVILIKDALGYHSLAITLMEHRRFALSRTEEPNTVRTPLYPIFIAGIYSLFGYKPWVVLLFQILLGTLSCLMLIVAFTRLFNRGIALIASFLYALDPFLILYSSTLLSDILFVILLVTALYAFSCAFKAKSTRKILVYYGISGFFIGLATLVRPISQYIPFILVVFFLVWYRGRLKDIIKYSCSAIIMFMLAISPWLIRNYHLFDRLAISSSGSHNLLIEYVVPMEMQNRRQDLKTVSNSLLAEADRMMLAEGLVPLNLNGFQKSDYYKKVAIRYIKGDPLHLMQTYFLGILHTFAEIDTSIFTSKLGISMPRVEIKAHTNILELIKEFIANKGATGLLIAGLIYPYLIVSYLGLAVGFFISWSRYNKGALLICLLMAMYFVLVTGVGGAVRFKIPSIPFYLVFSAMGIHYLRKKWKQRRMTEAKAK